VDGPVEIGSRSGEPGSQLVVGDVVATLGSPHRDSLDRHPDIRDADKQQRDLVSRVDRTAQEVDLVSHRI